MPINEPGEASQPEDTQGDGPVTLSDRTDPGGQGSPGSNQARPEPIAPATEHPEPLAIPDLDSMNVSATDPQAPRHPDALRSEMSATGAYAHEAPVQEPTRLSADGATPGAVDATATSGCAPDPEQPVQQTTGTAHRAPGIDGQTPDGESVTTDTSAGAARMGPQALDSRPGTSPGQGDDASVPSSGTAALEGTSQEHRIVTGIRLPEQD